jgi:DNA-binding transcriptional LysR family regulator
MDLRLIDMFQRVVTNGSFTETAQALGITQPAVSNAMARLERHLGFSLFRRNGRHLAPTKEAQAFYAETARVTREFNNLTKVAAGIASATRGTITIGSSPAPATFWLPPVIAQFQKSRDDVRVRLVSRSSREIRELADVDAFDLGIAEAPFTRRDDVIKRYRFSMVAFVQAGSELATHQKLTPRLVSKSKFISVKGALWTDAEISRAFEKSAVDMPIGAECDYMSSALGLVAYGGGVCLVDPVTASEVVDKRLVSRKFNPTIQYEIGIVKPARTRSSRLAEAFIDLLDKTLSNLAD